VLTITRHAVLVAVLVVAVVVVFLQPPIPQALDYHIMADRRPCPGIANCLDVLSNLPFAIIGIAGLVTTFGRRGGDRFADSWERWPCAALFAGVAATAVGSSYYHLAPDNARLVWDRLPMALGFIGLLTALLAERVSVALARRLLLPGIGLGAVSVLYWYWTELQGAGDLRLYVLVQFGSLLAVVLLLTLYRSRYHGTAYIVCGLALYAAAKVLELADGPIYSAIHLVSGHTLKHLAAAAATACVVGMLYARDTHSSRANTEQHSTAPSA
jgi:hypothetical protein